MEVTHDDRHLGPPAGVASGVAGSRAAGWRGHRAALSISAAAAIRRLGQPNPVFAADAVAEQTIEVVDTSAPVVTAVLPVDDAVNMAHDAALVLTFSEAVVAGSGTVRIMNADGSLCERIAVSGRGTVSIAAETVTLEHVPFVAGSVYHVLIEATCFQDVAGNAFAGITDLTAWTFAARPWVVQFGAGAYGALLGPSVQTVGGNPLTLNMVHDAKGRISSTAALQVNTGKALVPVVMPIRGGARGTAGALVVTLALQGANTAGAVSASLALNLTLNAVAHQLSGPVAGYLTVGAVTTPDLQPQPVVLEIPAPMDGTWTRSLDLVQGSRTLSGTVRLTLPLPSRDRPGRRGVDLGCRGAMVGLGGALRPQTTLKCPWHAEEIIRW